MCVCRKSMMMMMNGIHARQQVCAWCWWQHVVKMMLCPMSSPSSRTIFDMLTGDTEMLLLWPLVCISLLVFIIWLTYGFFNYSNSSGCLLVLSGARPRPATLPKFYLGQFVTNSSDYFISDFIHFWWPWLQLKVSKSYESRISFVLYLTQFSADRWGIWWHWSNLVWISRCKLRVRICLIKRNNRCCAGCIRKPCGLVFHYL